MNTGLRSTVLFCLMSLMFSSSIFAESNLEFKYFKNDDTAIIENFSQSVLARSVATKAYTLDMLYKTNRSIYNSLDLRYLSKTKPKTIDKKLKNKYGLIIDLRKVKNMTLDIYQDSKYMQYFSSVSREVILNYLLSLNPKNEPLLQKFSVEAAGFFGNNQFYLAYSNYLLRKKTNQDYDAIVNYCLLGGDYQQALTYLDKAKNYSDVQIVHIFEKADRFDLAYEKGLITFPKNHQELYRLAKAAGLYNEALAHYQLTADVSQQELALLNTNAGRYDKALSYALAAKMSDGMILDLYIKNDLLFDAYLLAEKIDDKRLDSITSSLADSTVTRLINYCSNNNKRTKAYDLAKKRNPHNSALLASITTGILDELRPHQNNKSIDYVALCIKYDQYSEAYNYCLTNEEYQKAVEIMENYPNNEYGNVKSTYTVAAKQLSDNSQTQNYDRIIYLYDKAQDWNNAGKYSAMKQSNNQAISYYLMSTTKDYEALVNLYEITANYPKAIEYQLLADSTACGKIASLYEKNNDFRTSALLYIKDNNAKKSIQLTEKTIPRDYKLLLKAYQLEGKDKQKINAYIDSLYSVDYLAAGEYYKNSEQLNKYREKLVEDKHYKTAAETYNDEDFQQYSDYDVVIDLYAKAGDKPNETKFLNRKLDAYSDYSDQLSIDELDDAIKLSSKLGNQVTKRKFVSLKSKEQARIAKEEKEEQARIAEEEREMTARRSMPESSIIAEIVGVYSGSLSYSNDIKTTMILSYDKTFYVSCPALESSYEGSYIIVRNDSSGITIRIHSFDDPWGMMDSNVTIQGKYLTYLGHSFTKN